MKEINITGQFYRILVDKTNKIWHRLSFWTKASDVQFDDGTFLQSKKFGHCILARSTDYNVGDVAYSTNAPSWVRLICETAGRTAAIEPQEYKTIQLPGAEVSDGTATFRVFDIRPSSLLNTNQYTIPDNSLINSVYEKSVEASQKANKINVYVGNDDKLHYVDKNGNDEALAFDPHDATFTFLGADKGATVDLGEIHNVKYLNASDVYAQGYTDGLSRNLDNIRITSKYHHHTINNTSADSASSSAGTYKDSYHASKSGGCFTKAVYKTVYKTRYVGMNRVYHIEDLGNGSARYHFKCPECGRECDDIDDSQCPHTEVAGKTLDYYGCNCGKKDKQLLEQTIEFV